MSRSSVQLAHAQEPAGHGPWHTISPLHRDSQDWTTFLCEFITAHSSLCNAHTVDFFTCDHWHNVVPERWRQEIGSTGVVCEDLLSTVSPDHEEGSLGHFLYTARSYSIPLVWGQSKVPIPDQLVRFGMTAKKSHEVANFSEYIVQLVSQGNIHQILDVGSGKGYLSQHLALRHGLCVVGVDAQETCTLGAQRRNKKVYKAWKSISRTHSQTCSPDKDHTCTDSTPHDTNSTNLFEKRDTATVSAINDIETSPSDSPAGKAGSPAIPTASNTAADGCLENVVTKEDERELLEGQVEATSYAALTHTIATDNVDDVTGFGKWAESVFDRAETDTGGRFSSKTPTCIVGLHTCGDLGGVALRLFLRQPQLQTVCVVGCCYHHITERDNVTVRCSEGVGFPMSNFLLSRGAVLGRTARMLACQAASRVSAISSGPALESVFRRAVLQVILQRNYPKVYAQKREELKIGRFRKMPVAFEDYVYAALQKLSLDTSLVTLKDISAAYGELEARKAQLSTHLKLRGVLASCIESLLLLDRLLFLQEHASTETVALVQLFDPLISPRCFAVVATKHT